MNENFLELLENYLDDKEIDLKRSLDDDCDYKKISNCKNSPFMKEDSITIREFVNRYIGLEADCSNLLHCGLKDLDCDYIMGIDNDFANRNPELVYCGYLLLVIDAHNNRGTYVNPNYLRNIFEKGEIEEQYNILLRIRINDLTKLKDYYIKYMELKDKIDNNEKFYVMLEKARKIKKVKEIVKKKGEIK